MASQGRRLPESWKDDEIQLRRWRPSDAEALGQVVAESVEHLRPWMPWVKQEPLGLQTRRDLIRRWEEQWSDGGDVLFGIFSRGQIVGSCGLHRRLGPDGLEIGYWIHPDFTRQGLATRAASLLTEAAFSLAEIGFVEIHHDKANVASGGVPRTLGFRLVGEVPDQIDAPGEVGVECVWRMERNAWRAPRPRAGRGTMAGR